MTTPEDAVRILLQSIGEDPAREGLLDTPKRVVKALKEMTAGYQMSPAEALGTTFAEKHDNMILLKGIRFSSLCEHHMLPFVGTASIGYVPGEKIVGLSKLARIVQVYAQRLQVQERMTEQIAQAIDRYISPAGVGVVIRAHHACMGCRGVKQPDALMTTSCLMGIMKHDSSARNELLALE